jgi:hypothetical protein
MWAALVADFISVEHPNGRTERIHYWNWRAGDRILPARVLG